MIFNKGTTNDDVEDGQLIPGPVEHDDIEGGQLLPGKVENDVIKDQDENENIQQNLKHERDLIKMTPPSSVDNNGGHDTPASASFDSAKTNTLLSTETSVGNKDIDTTIEESTSLNLTKHFEQPTSSLTVEISKIINEGTVVPSCEHDEYLLGVSVLKDEQNFSQDVPVSYKEIHEQRLSTDDNVVHVTSSKLNDIDRTYSNTSNNISSHIQTTDVHSNPVAQETHLDNMQSNTGNYKHLFVFRCFDYFLVLYMFVFFITPTGNPLYIISYMFSGGWYEFVMNLDVKAIPTLHNCVFFVVDN